MESLDVTAEQQILRGQLLD